MDRYALGNDFRSFTQLVLMVKCHDSKNNGISSDEREETFETTL